MNHCNAAASEPPARAGRQDGELIWTLRCDSFRSIPQPRGRASVGDPPPSEPRSHARESLDVIDLCEEFFRRRCVLKACLWIIKGRFRHIQRITLETTVATDRLTDPITLEHDWKHFDWLPTTLLHSPVESHEMESTLFESRFQSFARGAWDQLFRQSVNVATFRRTFSV